MKRKGPWTPEQSREFLERVRVPARIACNGASGFPVLASLWFVPLEDELWCATQESSAVVSHLARDPHCAFEVAEDTAPYRGVRGQGNARLHPERGESILRLAIERYLGSDDSAFVGWLLARAATETAIAVEPVTLLSWDFTARMGEVR